MNDDYDRQMPNFSQILAQRLSHKSINIEPTFGFDPHKVMVNRKKENDGEPIDTSNKIKWPEKDVKVLEDFCKKYGIVGYSFGNMSPLAALQMLKKQFGIDERPLNERIPMGYEKLGINKNNPHFPYDKVTKQKSLLNG